MKSKEEILTEKVRDWWENNPFTFGIVGSGNLVGRVDFDKMDLDYFKEIERKFRKHSRGGGQEDDVPLLSNLVDYKWLRKKKVLDVAVGSGFSLAAFAEGGADVVGIDITDFAVEQSKRNLQCRGLSGTVLKMDAQNMKFEDESFDFVNAWGCFMHMPDTQKAINEAYKVLKPGGRLLAYMYNKNSWTFWFNFIFIRGILLGKLLKYRFNIVRLVSRYTDGAPTGGNMLTKVYSSKKTSRMFERAGFSKVNVFPWDLPDEPDSWPIGKFPVFKYLPSKIKRFMSKRWGFGLIVQCEK